MNGPHQGGWIHTKYGEDWFIHFQDKGPYGRVCHLQPVDWSSGWPVMGNAGEPYWKFRKPKSDSKTIVNPVETDEFDSSKLGMQWQWQNDYKESYGQATSMGFFRLFTYALPELGDVSNLWYVPNMLLQKTPADEFTATTKLSFVRVIQTSMLVLSVCRPNIRLWVCNVPRTVTSYRYAIIRMPCVLT